MKIHKYPTCQDVITAIKQNEPLLVLISFDEKDVIISHIDEAVEHHILLAKAGAKLGYRQQDIDKFFRIVLDKDGADWTFVCPVDYKDISDKQRRLQEFYKDGFRIISNALSRIGYFVDINIPKRYKRHFDIMSDELILE